MRGAIYDVGGPEEVDVVRLERRDEVDDDRKGEPDIRKCEPTEEQLVGVVL